MYYKMYKIIPIIIYFILNIIYIDLATNNATNYEKFWKNFGKYVKVGIIEDDKNRDELVPLCRFFTSHDSSLTSLPEYKARMNADQKFIYYVVGMS